MKYLALIVIFGFVQAGVLAGTVSSPPPTGSFLEETIARAQLAIGNMTREVSKVLEVNDLTDSENVIKALTSGSRALAGKISSIVDDLKKQASNSGDIQGVIQSVQIRLNQTLQEIQAPEVQAKALQVQKQLESGLTNLIAESRRLANAAASNLSNSQSELYKISSKALEQVIDTATQVQNKIKGAINNVGA